MDYSIVIITTKGEVRARTIWDAEVFSATWLPSALQLPRDVSTPSGT
jgi:hypothetical protein